jgi:hypothetical protein
MSSFRYAVFIICTGIFSNELHGFLRISGLFQNFEEELKISRDTHSTCEVIPEIQGSEDLVRLNTTHLLFASSSQTNICFWSWSIPYLKECPPGGNGYFQTLDLATRTISKFEVDFEFNPHGLSVFPREKDFIILAINHVAPPVGPSTDLWWNLGYDLRDSRIEKFRFDGHRFSRLETIRNSLISSPNDLLALSEDSFLVTNDRYFVWRPLRLLELYLRFPLSTVVHWHGNDKPPSVVASWIRTANGLAISEDGASLFVASTMGGMIHKYRRDRGSSSHLWIHQEDILLGGAVDNLSITGDHLVAAAHVDPLFFPAFSEEFRRRKREGLPTEGLRSPSRITVHRVSDQTKSVNYVDDGSLVSCLTAAMVVPGFNVLVGTGFHSEGILLCPVQST